MRRRRFVLALLAAVPTSACELKEVSLTQPERVVVAEAYVRVSLGDPQSAGLPPSVSVFLHETLGATGGSSAVPGAKITITRAVGALSIPLAETAISDCAISLPERQSGTCYGAAAADAKAIAPGDRLALRIELPDGGVMASETTVPGAFQLHDVDQALTCVMPPLTPSGLVWSRSAGAWAYVSDTYIRGLSASFDTTKVDVEDPLYLFGLSVSAQDTAIVFPGEFGVFARGDLDHEVTTTLQKGLPDGVGATVSVSAVDRNWVNWARGANFNPSGVVRVPSVRGDGTGVFASTVVRTFKVASSATGPFANACPPPPAARQ